MSDSTFLFREEGSRTRLVMENFIAKNKIKIKKKIELTSNEAVKQSVIAGLGLSIMPLIGIRNEIETGLLKIIPIKGLPLNSTWSLIWQKDKMHSPIASAFLDYLKTHGILATGLIGLRFVTHLGVDPAGVDRAVASVKAFFAQGASGPALRAAGTAVY